MEAVRYTRGVDSADAKMGTIGMLVTGSSNIPWGGSVCQMQGCLTYGRRQRVEESISKGKFVKRPKRIEGQVWGIQKMIKKGRYCESILMQIAAIPKAVDGVGNSNRSLLSSIPCDAVFHSRNRPDTARPRDCVQRPYP